MFNVNSLMESAEIIFQENRGKLKRNRLNKVAFPN